jgi:hypothetical protein
LLFRGAFGGAIAAACALTALFSGCATAESPQARAVRAASTQLNVVISEAPDTAASRAAKEHEGDFTLCGVGDSMQPCYAAGTTIVVHPTSFFMLRAGMPVVYVGRNGHQRAHVLLERSERGWSVIGLNNEEPDEDLVTPDNLVGIITCAYVPSRWAGKASGDTLAFAETSPPGLLH